MGGGSPGRPRSPGRLLPVPPDTYLKDIVAAHRSRAAADTRVIDDLVARARTAPAPRPFAERLGVAVGGTLAVIAEVKRRSPSRGVLDGDLDPARAAADYAAGGAACLSVLTDGPHFGGSPADLRAARAACPLPVLRKDFTVCAADVCDARIMGADAVLLIVAALSDAELAEFLALAAQVSLAAVVEVHDELELERALDAGAAIVGVNQRDLATFSVDRDRAVAMAGAIPDDVVAVAESGIRGPDDAERLAAAGYQAVLVGESLVTAGDRTTAVSGLVGKAVGPRRAGGSPGATPCDRPAADGAPGTGF